MDSFKPNSIGVTTNRSITCVLTFMSILMSSGVMADEAFSWSNIGGGHSQTAKVLEKLEMLQVLMRDDKMELQSNIANLRMELNSAISEVHRTIGDLKAEVHTMNNNFLLDSRKVLSSDYDDKSVTTFLSLDELNIEPQERPVEEETESDVEVISEEITIVEEGFTAPVPEKPQQKVSFDGMNDEDIVITIINNIADYLEETPVLMNFSFKKKGIIPQDYQMPKSVKELLKEAVRMEGSEVKLHKLDKMRGMYYLSDVEDPEALYNETFN